MIIHVGEKLSAAAVFSSATVADVTPKNTTSWQPEAFSFVNWEANPAACWPEKYDVSAANVRPAALKPVDAFSPNSPSW